jgi:hypothetical protein
MSKNQDENNNENPSEGFKKGDLLFGSKKSLDYWPCLLIAVDQPEIHVLYFNDYRFGRISPDLAFKFRGKSKFFEQFKARHPTKKSLGLTEKALLAIAEAEFFSTIPAEDRLDWFEKWFLSDEAEDSSDLYRKFQEHMESQQPPKRPVRSCVKSVASKSNPQKTRRASKKPVVEASISLVRDEMINVYGCFISRVPEALYSFVK